MNRRVTLLLLIGILAGSSALNAQSDEYLSYLSFKLQPGIAFPMGESGRFFKLGGNVGLSGTYRMPFLPLVTATGELGYNLLPVNTDTGESVSVLTISAGPGFYYNLSRFIFQASVMGGSYMGFINQQGGAGTLFPYLTGRAGVSYAILPYLSAGIEGVYKGYLGLYNGIGVSLGVAYHLKARKRGLVFRRGPEAKPSPLIAEEVSAKGGLEITDLELATLFPVMFKYYDDHPVGKAVLKNVESSSIGDIKVSLFVKQYMDRPKAANAPSSVEPGQSAEVDLNALFTDKVLGITEGTKVATQITVEYTYQGQRYKKTGESTLRLYDRNSLTWDDDRKVAAFVTAKDPDVLSFAKYVSGIVTSRGSQAVNKNLRIAMGMHETMDLYGMNYVIDPRTPYAELSKDKLAVDFVQFPRHSLAYLAGDCDDLSILYNALLESVGIETAFITIPGHILTAFSLNMTPEEARKNFFRVDDLIFQGDQTWVPVEVTEIGGGFLKAWQIGAKEWREYSPKDQAGFYPTQEAWQLYEPVGLPDPAGGIELPGRDQVAANYLDEVTTFIDQEIYPQVTELQKEIAGAKGSVKKVNKLGVLYSKYGLYDRAETEFQKVLSAQEYVPALVNLGNIYYLREEYKAASGYYGRARAKAPDSPTVLLCVARVNHELENYGAVEETYAKLKSMNPELALRFSYLESRREESARAAEIGQLKEIVVWEEEE